MKAEPLKGKVMIGDKFPGGCTNSANDDDNVLFKSKDIQSAVEWFKQKLDKSELMAHSIYLTGVIYQLIDKAFEDVIEKEGGKNETKFVK